MEKFIVFVHLERSSAPMDYVYGPMSEQKAAALAEELYQRPGVSDAFAFPLTAPTEG